jgi:alpha-galactosidase
MLQIGDAGLSPIEARSHFGAWAVVAAPLLIAADIVSGLDPDSLEVLSAPEVIAVDQDPLGVQGVRVSPHQPQGTECWARPLYDGGIALLLLNRAPLASANVLCDFAQAGVLKPGEGVKVRDLWARADLGVFVGNFTAGNVPPHGSMLVKLTQ